MRTPGVASADDREQDPREDAGHGEGVPERPLRGEPEVRNDTAVLERAAGEAEAVLKQKAGPTSGPGQLGSARRRGRRDGRSDRLGAEGTGRGSRSTSRPMNSAITTDNSSARFIFPSGNRRDKAPALAMSPKRSVTVLLFAVVTASFLSIGVSGRMVRGANSLQIVVFQPCPN